MNGPASSAGNSSGIAASAAAALLAYEIMSAMPANADTLPAFPIRHAITDCMNASRDFMTRHTWILKPGPEAVFDNKIAVTNATRLHLHAHLSATWLRNFAFD